MVIGAPLIEMQAASPKKQSIDIDTPLPPDNGTDQASYTISQFNNMVDSDSARLTKTEIDTMWRDATFRTAWNLRNTMEIMAGYHWEYAGDDEELRDTLTQHIEWQFEHVDCGSGMNRGIWDVYDTLTIPDKYGHCVYERVYDYDSDHEQVTLKYWKPLNPDNDEFVWNEYGRIQEYTQDFRPTKKLAYEDFIHIACGAYGENWVNPYGDSELRATYRYWHIKDKIIKYWLDAVERKSVPPIIAYLPAAASAAQKKQLDDALGALKPRNVIRLPADTKEQPGARVEQLPAQDYTGVFEPLITYCDKMINQSMMLPDLLLNGASADGTGSRALGRVHEDMLTAVIRGRHKRRTGVINRLVREICIFNFADKLEKDKDGNPIYPIFTMNMPQFRDLSEKAQALGLLIDKQVVSPEEAWIREFAELPPKSEEQREADEAKLKRKVEDELKQAEEPELEMPEAPAMPVSPPGETTELNETPEEPGEREEAEAEAPVVVNAYKSKENEKQLRATIDKFETRLKARIMDWMDRVTSRMANEAEKRMGRADKDGELTAAAPGVNFDYSQMNKVVVNEREVQELASMLDNSGSEAARRGAKDLSKWDIPQVKPERAIKWLKAQNDLNSKVMSEAVQKNVQQILITGLKNGSSPADMRAEIEGLYSDMSKGQIDTIIRTNTMSAYNEGRVDGMKDSEIVEGAYADAIIDDRTTDYCESINGKFIPKDELAGNSPPYHYNCRTVLSPATRYDSDRDQRQTLDKSTLPPRMEGF